MVVINLFGIPSSGKSTGSAYIFSKLKMLGYNAELITEFAKDKVWEENEEVFKNQLYILGKQSFKQSRVRDKVEVIITDSPLMLSAFYNSDETLGEEFNAVVKNVFNSYDNINFFLNRVKPYNPIGRHQTEEESDALKAPMMKMLIDNGIPFIEANGSLQEYDGIVGFIDNHLQSKRNKLDV